MPCYKVIWEIDIDADTPLEAAKQAEEIQKSPESTATVFGVTDPETGISVEVDLDTNEVTPT